MASVNVDLNYLFLLLILCIPAAVYLLPVLWRLRERARLLEIAKSAVEHGAPVPVELLDSMRSATTRPSSDRDFRNGVILIAVGIGVAVLGLGLRPALEALLFLEGGALGIAITAAGAVPAMIGVALILLSRLQKRSKDV